MASSIASLVPEPMAKCAVWALSPISTTWLLPLKWLHLPQIRRWKLSQAEPRRWRALVISLCAVQRLGEQALAECDRLVLVHLAEAVRLEHVLGRLDDEGRGLGVEPVDVRLEPAVLGLAEVEGEGVELLVGAEPDVAVGPHHHVGLEDVGIFVADAWN